MALDFPASPATNQTYSGPGGVVWVWDGAKWVSGTGSTVYAPVTSPVFLGNPTAPNPPAGDADTSVATTQFVAAAVGTALHDTGRNLLHNPLMAVAQRGAGPWTASGAYTLDRWVVGINSDTASFSQVLVSDAARAQIGDEAASYCIGNVFTGNAAAGANNFIQQSMEGARRLSGKTVTLSFWAAALSGTPKLGVNYYQAFGSGGSPSAFVWANATGQAITLSTTWTRYSITTVLPSTAGKTFGTNRDDITGLLIYYSSGATGNAIAGNIGVQSGTVWLWGVQLEIGSVATPLEKPDPRDDLANCQRFYSNYSFRYDGYGAGTNMSYVFSFPTMRASPTVAFSGTAYTACSGISTTMINSNTLVVFVALASLTTFNVLTNMTLSADL